MLVATTTTTTTTTSSSSPIATTLQPIHIDKKTFPELFEHNRKHLDDRNMRLLYGYIGGLNPKLNVTSPTDQNTQWSHVFKWIDEDKHSIYAIQISKLELYEYDLRKLASIARAVNATECTFVPISNENERSTSTSTDTRTEEHIWFYFNTTEDALFYTELPRHNIFLTSDQIKSKPSYRLCTRKEINPHTYPSNKLTGLCLDYAKLVLGHLVCEFQLHLDELTIMSNDLKIRNSRNSRGVSVKLYDFKLIVKGVSNRIDVIRIQHIFCDMCIDPRFIITEILWTRPGKQLIFNISQQYDTIVGTTRVRDDGDGDTSVTIMDTKYRKLDNSFE